jgi:hypothetical protein
VKAEKSTSIEIRPNSKAGISSLPKSFTNRLSGVENLSKAILAVALISLVGIIVTVSAMVLDQMHFNNQAYRDQSDKTNLQIQELNLRIDALKSQLGGSE